MGTKADKRARRLAAEMSDNFKRNEDIQVVVLLRC